MLLKEAVEERTDVDGAAFKAAADLTDAAPDPALAQTPDSALWWRDPHLWALGALAYLVLALVLTIAATEYQRQAETALDLALRRTGAEMALRLSAADAGAGLAAEERTALARLWLTTADALPARERLFAAVTNANRQVMWSAGTGAEALPAHTVITSAFPVPNRPVTVTVGYTAAPQLGGLAGLLTLFVIFAAIPALGAYLLFRPRGGGAPEPERGQPDFLPPRASQDRPLAEALTKAGCAVGQWRGQARSIDVSRSLLALRGEAVLPTGRDARLTRAEFRALFDIDDQDLLERIEARARQGERVMELDCTLLDTEDESVPLCMTVIALPADEDAAPAPLHFAAVWTRRPVLDAQGTPEEADMAAPDRFALLLEGLPDGLALWDDEGYLVAANHLFAERLDLDWSKLDPTLHRSALGDLADLIEAEGACYRRAAILLDDGAGELTILRDVTRELSRAEDVRVLRKDLAARDRDIATLDDAVAQLNTVLEEVTQKADRESRRADAAQHAMAEFLANASHELRTPLNAILGFSEMIQQEIFGPLGNEKYQEYVTDIHTSGKNLLGLIQDLLDMSRLGSGKVEMDPARIDLEDLLEDTLRLARPQADEKDLRLSLAAVEVPSCYADPQAAKRILLHLLSNAIKFTPAGGSVTLAAHADLRMVAITVTDTGIGIEPEDLERIGKPFARTRRSEESGQGGMGLGLAMSRTLAELNGGRITLDSEPGEGTTVTLSLPRRPANEGHGDTADKPRRGQAAA